MTEPIQPNPSSAETYTRPQMESRTYGREVQADSPERANESISHAAEDVRGLVQSLMDGGADASQDEVVARLSMGGSINTMLSDLGNSM